MRFRGEWYWDHIAAGIVIETAVYLALVGLLWYLVSIEIGGNGESCLTPKTKIRRTADVIAMIFGCAVAAFGLSIRRYEFGFVSAYSTLIAAPYFLWAAATVAFYGRDLWKSLPAARAVSRAR